MNFTNAEYIASYPKVSSCPTTDMLEFAFIGRSNVGKSSLINMITNKKALAKVSNTPGKTQMINFFLIDNAWYLVDLPGYGYARVDKGKKMQFSKMMLDYLKKRESLYCSFLLIDIRLTLQKIDREFMQWMGENNLPFVIIFTKSDKLTKLQLQHNIKQFNAALLEEWEYLPHQFITSSETRLGKEEVCAFIQESIKSR